MLDILISTSILREIWDANLVDVRNLAFLILHVLGLRSPPVNLENLAESRAFLTGMSKLDGTGIFVVNYL